MVGKLGLNQNTLYQHARYWLPAVVTGALAWVAFMILGQTPLIRASGLALVVVVRRRIGSVDLDALTTLKG